MFLLKRSSDGFGLEINKQYQNLANTFSHVSLGTTFVLKSVRRLRLEGVRNRPILPNSDAHPQPMNLYYITLLPLLLLLNVH